MNSSDRQFSADWGSKLARAFSRPVCLSLLLAAATLAVYWRALGCDFIDYDDPDYFSNNPRVQAGLNLSGVRWAFTTVTSANWHPLTWLSLMLDATLFGKGPAGPHLTNVLLHTANAFLLFWVLWRLTGPQPGSARGPRAESGGPPDSLPIHTSPDVTTADERGALGETNSECEKGFGGPPKPTRQRRMVPTGALWPSAAVAALFALHPLHVESVAWISERKDVLSTFFGLLALLFYAVYARRVTSDKWSAFAGLRRDKQVTGTEESLPVPGLSRVTCHPSLAYGLALFFFALALMSKPMAVTLPFLLLLLDCWPLGRVASDPPSPGFGAASKWRVARARHLVLEKIPFFLLSAVSCVITFMAQHKGGAVVALTRLSVSLRVENAFVSYARYLGKTFWPTALAAPYPHPEFWLANPPPGFWPAGLVWFSVALFAGLSVTAVWCWRKFPFVPVGWFWFVGTLIPVIGLVQVGTQSMADRYTYLPLIGVFMVLSWGVAEAQARWRLSQRGIALLTAVVLAACAARARNQIGFWQNDGSLFFHALTVTRNNYVACVNLGTWFSKNGQIEETLRCYYMALKMNPSDPSVLYDVGNAFAKIGYWDEAISQYRHALQITPNEADILNNLGFALTAQKQYAEAITNFEAALKLKPDLAGAHNNLAAVLSIEHRFAEAAQHYRDAIRLTPDDPRIQVNLGDTLVRLGQPAEAGQCYREALRLNPGDPKITAKLQALGAGTAK